MTEARDAEATCPVFILNPLFFFQNASFLSSHPDLFRKPHGLILISFLTETLNENQLIQHTQDKNPGFQNLVLLTTWRPDKSQCPVRDAEGPATVGAWINSFVPFRFLPISLLDWSCFLLPTPLSIPYSHPCAAQTLKRVFTNLFTLRTYPNGPQSGRRQFYGNQFPDPQRPYGFFFYQNHSTWERACGPGVLLVSCFQLPIHLSPKNK